MECCLRTDNDEGAIEELAEEKEDKARGLDWNVLHVSFITGWKTSMDEEKWEQNLTLLGIAMPKHRDILQRAADAALRAFGSMTDARMGASDTSIT
eukprot:1785920-Rhodomonas_salina.1